MKQALLGIFAGLREGSISFVGDAQQRLRNGFTHQRGRDTASRELRRDKIDGSLPQRTETCLAVIPGLPQDYCSISRSNPGR